MSVIEQILEIAVRTANENNERMDGTAERVFEIMDAADIVLAVWNDAEAEFGVGFRVVKGHEQLQRTVATQQPVDLSVTGILCAGGDDQAMALESAYAQRTLRRGN